MKVFAVWSVAQLTASLLSLFNGPMHAHAETVSFGGGAGQALFIDYLQGAFVEDFPLPPNEISVEFWTKLLPVSTFGWPCFQAVFQIQQPSNCCLLFAATRDRLHWRLLVFV
jgi:hypothetical protein